MKKAANSATLVAIAKNERKYIAEWIAYHLAIGFDRIIVYDNESEDDTAAVVGEIARRDYRVTLRSWRSESGRSPQVSAYEHALGSIETTWLMFMDIDEFLVPFGSQDLPDYISSLPDDVSSVHINWRGFGSGGVMDPDYGLVTRTFSRCSDRRWGNNHHFKSLAKTALVKAVFVHDIETVEGRRVLSDFNEFKTTNNGMSDWIVHRGIQINHYQCKTFPEFQARMRRGNAYFPPGHPGRDRDASVERFKVLDRNDDEDRSIRLFDRLFEVELRRVGLPVPFGPFDSIIGIGGNCEVAHHIRRRFQIDSAQVFDWWILPFQSALKLVNEDFADLYNSDNLEVVGNRLVVRCKRYDILHHHDFPRDDKALVITDAIESELPRLRDKSSALLARLRTACGPGRDVLFIRSWRDVLHAPADYPLQLPDDAPAVDFERFIAALKRRFPEANVKVLFVNYGRHRFDHPDAIFDNVADRGDIKDWSGSALGWDEVFDRNAIRLKP